jgi:hypothetical protein
MQCYQIVLLVVFVLKALCTVVRSVILSPEAVDLHFTVEGGWCQLIAKRQFKLLI